MRYLFSGGGTGGHIYPAVSLIKKILSEEPEAEILYVGTANGLESKIVPKEKINFKTIKIQGFKRSLSFDNLRTLGLIVTSVLEARRIIKDFKPDVVVGTGGYVCGPVLYAASQLRIPTLLHEQNSVAGVTNKLLAKAASRICLCFEDARVDFPKYGDKISLTGNPRGQEVAQVEKDPLILEQFNLKPDQPTVLIFGGSRGAPSINQAFLASYDQFANCGYQVLMVTGQAHYKAIQEELASKPALANVAVVPYVDQMPVVFKTVDVVVCRSGATTLTELTALGIPSILIPSPYVTNNHQQKNAESLLHQGACRMILQKDLTGPVLSAELKSLMQDKTGREAMGVKAASMGIRDANDRLYTILKEVTS